MQTNTSLLWTLEEISHLVSGSGNPSETLTNIVNLIQQRFVTDVCSVYLLEPDRDDAGAGRHHRPAPGRCRPRAHARHRGAGRPGRRAGPPDRRRKRDAASAFQVLPRGRGGPVHDVPRRAGHRPRRAAGRARRPDGRRADVRRRRRADADDRGHAAGAHRQRGAQRRALRRPAASEAGGAGAESVVDVGRGVVQHLPRDRSGAVARLRPQSHRPAPEDAGQPARGAGVAALAARAHQLRLPPHAGVPRSRSTPGGRSMPASSAHGRSPTSRPSSACTNRCRSIPAVSASSPAIT